MGERQPLPGHFQKGGGVFFQHPHPGQPAEKDAQMHHFHPHGAAGHAAGLQMPEELRKRADVHMGKISVFRTQKPGEFLQRLPHGKLVGGAQAFLCGQKTDEAFQMGFHGVTSPAR